MAPRCWERAPSTTSKAALSHVGSNVRFARKRTIRRAIRSPRRRGRAAAHEGLSAHRWQLFFDPLFHLAPFCRGKFYRPDKLVGIELIRRRDVLDPHIGLDRLPRDFGKLRIDRPEPKGGTKPKEVPTSCP